ncbi:vWA domain-containing protein [Legionella oakridgensis]|uniref:vWA domain-containing protein n=1 Tax=Legionella oakridgensis TaxID=29423 RepID=UPI0003DE169E|nr:VWA domain-containing protein [Legionella oakridgensis]ETO92188.1 von willebrand factor type A domain protein [Legionella oakridgensis RV-2-2007]
MIEFHFIRPFWLFSFVPLALFAWFLLQYKPAMQAWGEVCDNHLLPYLIKSHGRSKRMTSLMLLMMSAALMIIALAGPTWSRLPVPTYKSIQPRVLILDMSEQMLEKDLSPDRFTRAKFKLHDLFKHKEAGQFGLVVYTGEPFVVSPLTDDAETIDALLSSLAPDIMPVEGNRLDTALEQAGKLITQAGFNNGDVLILTAMPPSSAAINEARRLANQGIHTSVMPIVKSSFPESLFQPLAVAGQGELIAFSDTSTDMEKWLRTTGKSHQFSADLQHDIPVWRDQGRWFLVPALLLLLPVFQRGWLQRITA